MLGLKNKVVIVTGSGQGIGEAAAMRFAAESCKIVVADFNTESGNAVADKINTTGGNAEFIKVDISDRDSVKKMVTEAVDKFNRIDVLVNNAGILEDATLKKMSDEQFDRVVNVNMRGTFICTQEVSHIMREQQSGVILNASSVVALYGNYGQTNYVASKAGVIGMTKVWARELGKEGIRVNAVAPGFIKTPIIKDIPEKIIDALIEKVPLKRIGTPEDVANVYLFLASDLASYVTGTVVGVDGGVVV
tara:strand:- start:25739 stop:26482 length:744 start_codon:yes stop_codon:yes gene_type:complete